MCLKDMTRFGYTLVCVWKVGQVLRLIDKHLPCTRGEKVGTVDETQAISLNWTRSVFCLLQTLVWWNDPLFSTGKASKNLSISAVANWAERGCKGWEDTTSGSFLNDGPAKKSTGRFLMTHSSWFRNRIHISCNIHVFQKTITTYKLVLVKIPCLSFRGGLWQHFHWNWSEIMQNWGLHRAGFHVPYPEGPCCWRGGNKLASEWPAWDSLPRLEVCC